MRPTRRWLAFLFLLATRCDFDRATQQCQATGHCLTDDAGVAPPDAGSASDAGPADAGLRDAGTQDAGTWCQVHAPQDVCFDYDGPDAGVLMPNVQCMLGAGGCTVTLDVQPDTDSPPNALVATVPALGAYPDSAVAHDGYFWPGGVGTATIGFDVRSDLPAGVLLAAVTWGTVIYQVGYGGAGPPMMYPDGNVVVSEQSFQADSGIPSYTYVFHPGDAGVDLTQWHRFVLTVSRSGNAVTLTLDGASVITDTLQGVPLSGSVAFQWGIGYVNGPFSTPTQYHFDNVVLRGTTP